MGAEGGEIPFDGDVGLDGSEFLAEFDLGAIVLEAFAVHFAFDFGSAVEGLFDGTKFGDDVARAFVTDAGSAGDVIDGVAFEGKQVGDLGGLDAHELFDFGFVVPFVVLHRVEHEDAFVDELEHVLITRDDDDFKRFGGFATGDGADDVVGFVGGELEDGDVHGLEEAADVGDLLGEIGGHFGAVGFIFGELGGADGRFGGFEDGGDVIGFEGRHELAQHVVEDEDGFSGEAGGGAHGRAPLRARA